MPKVIYVAVDGTQRVVDGTVGESVMATAVKNGISGIVAECGGSCTCATCHVYVRPEFFDLVGPPNEFEDELLDMATTDRHDTSRLSCQMKVTEEFDGLTVDIPPVQP